MGLNLCSIVRLCDPLGFVTLNLCSIVWCDRWNPWDQICAALCSCVTAGPCDSPQLLAPAVDWLDYLSSALSPLDLNDTEPVVVYAKEYLQQVSDLINKTDRR